MSRVLDPAQHSDWMLLLMEGGFSSVEMKVLQARMKEGREEAFRAGKYLSGRPPMPYVYDKQISGLRIDPEQLETFKTIIKLAETDSIRSIAKTLNISLTKIRRITADDRLLFYQSKRLDPQTGEEIDGQWPAVITQKQAATIKQNRTVGHTNARRKITGLLSRLGLMTCHYCGKSVRTWANGKQRADGTRLSYYGCPTISDRSKCRKSRMIPQSVIDNAVITSFIKTTSDPDLKDYWLSNLKEDDNTALIAQVEAEIKKLQTQKSRLIAAITEGVIEFVDAKQKRIDIDAATNACKIRLDQLQVEPEEEPDWDNINITSEEWEEATLDEKRELFQAAIKTIDISADRMLITYKFPRKTNGSRISEMKIPPAGKAGVGQVWK